MTFEWKHPNYYKQLRKLRESEEEGVGQQSGQG